MTAAAGSTRIGDAERSAAASRLGWYFSQGRLDRAELDDRLDRAMHARTAAELSALFTDLPVDPAAPPAGGARPAAAGCPPPAPSRHGGRRVLGAVLLVVAAAIALGALSHSLIVWAAVLVIIVVMARRRRARPRQLPPSAL